MHKVLVVDDHPFIRSSVVMLLRLEGFEVVAEAANGTEAVQLARKHAPDLIVLDIIMPGLDGLEVISAIRALGVSSKVVVLTSQTAIFYAMRCLKAGASGYISKTDDLSELVKAIRAVMGGYAFFPSLAMNSVCRSDWDVTEVELVQRLSDRELSILKKLAEGFSNKEIGETMQISNKTVSTYKTRIIEKLNVKSVVYLADFAKRNNLI